MSSVKFECPSCHAVGNRVAPLPLPNSDMVCVPPGHEITGRNGDRDRQMVCFRGGHPERWPLVLYWP